MIVMIVVEEFYYYIRLICSKISKVAHLRFQCVHFSQVASETIDCCHKFCATERNSCRNTYLSCQKIKLPVFMH